MASALARGSSVEAISARTRLPLDFFEVLSCFPDFELFAASQGCQIGNDSFSRCYLWPQNKASGRLHIGAHQTGQALRFLPCTDITLLYNTLTQPRDLKHFVGYQKRCRKSFQEGMMCFTECTYCCRRQAVRKGMRIKETLSIPPSV